MAKVISFFMRICDYFSLPIAQATTQLVLTALCWAIKIIVYAFVVIWFSNASLLQAMTAAFAGELGSIIHADPAVPDQL